MARKSGNVFEKHVEKGVFGLTALVLLFVVVQYLIRSPNSVTLGTDEAGPAQVDLLVKQKAEQVLAQVRNAKPKADKTPTAERTVKQAPLRNPTILNKAVAHRLAVLDVGNFNRGPGSSSVVLASVLAPSRPVVDFGRSLIQKRMLPYPELGSSEFGMNRTTARLAVRAAPVRSSVSRAGGSRGGAARGSGHGGSRNAGRSRGGGHGSRGAGRAGGRGRQAAPPRMAPRAPVVRRPAVVGGRPFLGGAGNEPDPLAREDANWVTVYATFDVEKQQELFKEASYSLSRREVTFLWPQVQRRALSNGAWADWEAVNAFEPYVRVTTPTLETGPQGRPTDTVRANVDLFTGTIRNFQPEVIRPGFLDLVAGRRWGIPLPRLAGIDAKMFDGEGDNRFTTILASFDPNYVPPDDGIDTGEPWWKITERRAKQDRAEQRRLDQLGKRLEGASPEEQARIMAREDLKVADDLLKAGDLMGARAQLQKVIEDELVSAGVKSQADEKLQTVFQKISEAREKFMAEAAAQARQDEQKAKLAGFGIDATGLIGRPPVTLLWAHDLSAKPGVTYQYRMRVRLLNAYAGLPDRLEDPNDARKLFIEGAWSEPSEPADVEPDVHFFVSKSGKTGARVQIYKWVMGQWARHNFPAEIGEKLGKPATVPLGLIDEQRARRTEVDFGSDNIVVDLDLARKVGGAGKTTVAMVYLDIQGELRERLGTGNRDGELKKTLDSQVFRKPVGLPDQERRTNRRTTRAPRASGGAGHGSRGGGRASGRRGGSRSRGG